MMLYRQTAQLEKSTINFSMRHHLEARFQILKHKRLNEVIIAVETYLAKNRLKAIIMNKRLRNDIKICMRQV
jgi:hypothetical protein